MKFHTRKILAAISVGLIAFVGACGLADDADSQRTVTVTETRAGASGKTTVDAIPSPNPEDTTEPKVEQRDVVPCSLDAVHENSDLASLDVVLECRGNFMYAGKKQTDDLRLLHYKNGMWNEVNRSGRTNTGFLCYSQALIDSLGVPQSIADRLTICTESSQNSESSKHTNTASAGDDDPQHKLPSCDGRNILIVHSVIGGDPTEVQNALEQYPGSYYIDPGQCSSLRASVGGQKVVPVYLDFGSDEAGMCNAKARLGGNARTLNNVADFSDPC